MSFSDAADLGELLLWRAEPRTLHRVSENNWEIGTEQCHLIDRDLTELFNRGFYLFDSGVCYLPGLLFRRLGRFVNALFNPVYRTTPPPNTTVVPTVATKFRNAFLDRFVDPLLYFCCRRVPQIS